MCGRGRLYPRSIISVSVSLAAVFLIPFSAHASSAEMYYSMGQRYMKDGDFDMAVLALKEAVKLSPDWAEAHNALGEAYVGLLRFREAVAEFDRAIELKDDYTQAKINRRRAMMSLRRYEPVRGSRLSRWHKVVILGGLTAAITVVSALIIYLHS